MAARRRHCANDVGGALRIRVDSRFRAPQHLDPEHRRFLTAFEPRRRHLPLCSAAVTPHAKPTSSPGSPYTPSNRQDTERKTCSGHRRTGGIALRALPQPSSPLCCPAYCWQGCCSVDVQSSAFSAASTMHLARPASQLTRLGHRLYGSRGLGRPAAARGPTDWPKCPHGRRRSSPRRRTTLASGAHWPAARSGCLMSWLSTAGIAPPAKERTNTLDPLSWHETRGLLIVALVRS